MKSILLPSLLVLSPAAQAQSSTWDVHPLNMIPCPQWIYPEPDCGGCGSCRMAIDSDPLEMDGGRLEWSADLAMCPHPIDTLGNNVVVITNWPIAADAGSYLYGQVQFHQSMRIDTLDLICASWAGGPDSVEIAVQFNETDPLTTTTVLQSALTPAYQHYIATDLGAVPMNGTSAVVNVYLRAHGGDQWFLFKEMRVVASPDLSASIIETTEDNIFIQPDNAGVKISVPSRTAITICDAAGRITWFHEVAAGTVFIPLADGLSIVRAGTHVRRIVR